MGTRFRAARAAVCLCPVVLIFALASSGCRRALHSTPVQTETSPPSTQPVALAAQPAGSSTTAPTSAPATAPAERTFQSQQAGLRLRYPGDWSQKQSKDDVLLLVPAAGGTDRSITLDLPKIPMHLPGAMTMPLIENGFIDDQKKHHAGLKVEEKSDQTIAGSKARLVRSTWKANGKDYTDVALLIVHNDKVYILSLDADQDGFASTRAAMDKLAQSIEWLK